MARPVKLSDQKKDWYRKKHPKRLYHTRPERKRILIVCEGEKTEPNYFEAIRKKLPPHLVEISIAGMGANTQSLVNCAKARRDEKKDSDYPYDEVWVVFDRDSFPPDAFDNAIYSAEAAGMNAAWSNEAFELWYILHFEDRQTGMSRNEYSKCLENYLKQPYRKNDLAMHEKLTRLGDESLAVKRAVRLHSESRETGTPPHQANPCTTVYELVGLLNKFRAFTFCLEKDSKK